MEQTQQQPQIQPQAEQKPQFPTEEVTLPSKGLLYPEGSPLRSGKVTMKYMTAREEDILTNQNYIKNGKIIKIKPSKKKKNTKTNNKEIRKDPNSPFAVLEKLL